MCRSTDDAAETEFRIRGNNMDSIHLNVSRPFWETLLFKIAGSSVLILIGVALVYFRKQKKVSANLKLP